MWHLLSVLGVAGLLGAQPALCQTAARQAGYLYLSPVPQASYVSAQTRYVLVRFVNLSPLAVSNLTTDFITIIGANSGPHSGRTHLATDGKTVIFEMDTDFSPDELVTVDLDPVLNPGAAGSADPFEYQFRITAPMPGSLPLAAVPPRTQMPVAAGQSITQPRMSRQAGQSRRVRKAMVLSNGVSVPSDFPQVTITANTNPSPGSLFLVNGLGGVPPYTMMLDNSGLPVWYRRGRMYDFKIQKNGMITWAQSDDTGFSAFDQNFNYRRTYLTTNGYLTDSHELKVLPDGSYYMIGYRTNAVDLSRYIVEGLSTAVVRETVVQGFTAADELIFQWRAWDNFNIQDLGGNTDFPHMNGLDIDEDGNVLLSSRHLSEITKINKDSGDIIWRLSGAHSSFTFSNDPLNGTGFQHNISALGNSHYMVFDNGNGRIPQLSRAVEYQLDLTSRIATLVWQFRDTPDKYAYWLGSAQRLPTGNTLIDFVMAKYPKAIEVDSNGVKRFELSLTPSSDSYRAFRLPWTGPVSAPYLVVELQPDHLTLLFNKFGDTRVTSYRVYGGNSPHPTTVVAQSNTTLLQLTNLQNGTYFFRVTALDAGGVESPFSNEESINVHFSQPDQNLVQNGDFSLGYNSWVFFTAGTASASWSIANGASQFFVTNGGTSLSSIQLLQRGMALVQGSQYVLQFDAWADQSQYIQAQLVQDGGDFIDYAGLAASFVTPNRTHYRYVFTMNQASDFSANLVFNLGTTTGAVYLGNISLFRPAAADLNIDGRVDLVDLGIFCGNWLQQKAALQGDLNGDGMVDFKDLSLFGQNWGQGLP